MISVGGTTPGRPLPPTGTGPPRAPPFEARPRSAICAFSSTRSGVKDRGVRVDSSATRIAAAVRREIRRAGCVEVRPSIADTEAERA